MLAMLVVAAEQSKIFIFNLSFVATVVLKYLCPHCIILKQT